jgi:hypothetical protein
VERERATAAAQVLVAAELIASATAISRAVVEGIATPLEGEVGDSTARARAAIVLADRPALEDPEVAVAEVSEEVAEDGDGRRRREDKGVSI